MLCSLFGKSRQAYYQRRKTAVRNVITEEILLQMIAKERRLMPRLGGRKLHYKLQASLPEHMHMGRDKFFDFLRSHNLLIRRRRYRAVTTMSHHWLRKYGNLIKDYIVRSPNQVWVSDITYLETKLGFVYLFLITDAYSRKIVGWKVSQTLEAKNALNALHMAMDSVSEKKSGIIHHSDRGIQYCSYAYVKQLQDKGFKISMCEKADPLENAIAERVNGILKTEWINDLELNNLDEAIKEISKVIEIYNKHRPHSSIELLTPNQAHQVNGELKRYWKNYWKIKPQQMDLYLST